MTLQKGRHSGGLSLIYPRFFHDFVGGRSLKVELETSELGELWALYAQIRAKLTAKIEAEIRIIERRLSLLNEERHGEMSRDARSLERQGTEALAGLSDASAPAIFSDAADQGLTGPLRA